MTVLVGAVLLAACSALADVTTGCWTDGFDTELLHPRWEWQRENPGMWELNSYDYGSLTILTEPGGLLYEQNDARNVLLTDVSQSGFDMIVELSFEPSENYHFAGIVVYGDDDNFITFGQAYCDHEGERVGSGLYLDHEEQGVHLPGNSATPLEISWCPPYCDTFRLVHVGPYFLAYYSLPSDNVGTIPGKTSWQLIGIRESMELEDLRVGIGAWGGTASIPAVFRSVSLNPDQGPALGFAGTWESDEAQYIIDEVDGALMLGNLSTGEAFWIAYTGLLHVVSTVWHDTDPTDFKAIEAEVLFDDEGKPAEIVFPNGERLRMAIPSPVPIP